MTSLNPIQLEKYLVGVDYPVKKADLIIQARKNGANQEALETLQHLPERSYVSPTEISKSVSGVKQKDL